MGKKELMNNKFWKNKKVFITGHTGFKGSWLSVYLYSLGAKIYGYSLKETNNSIFRFAKLNSIFEKSIHGDILDKGKLSKSLKKIKPTIVFHLAAQSLVTKAFQKPILTFDTNITGTANLLSALSEINSIKICMVTTTDKVYKPVNKNKYFSENDLLGGTEPYSLSKVCVENYLNTVCEFLNFTSLSVRSGNVVGYGDYTEGRIIPDILRAIKAKQNLQIRNSKAIRPWLYILDSLNGYINLVERVSNKKINVKKISSWNFAPNKSDHVNVLSLVKKFKKYNNFSYSIKKKKLKENKYLKLDSSKSKKIISWIPKYNINKIVNELSGLYNVKPNLKLMLQIIDNYKLAKGK